jgi:hypothetical protein
MIRVAPHFRAFRSRYELPDGQITARPQNHLSSPLTKNISLFQKCKSGVGKAVSCPQEGRIAIVTDVGCGMRWTRRCARRAQVVADGQVAWSRSPDAGIKLAAWRCRPCGPTRRAGDGGYQARYTGESAKQPLKPLRRECRRVSAYLWWLARVISILHARLRVRRASGIPCALCMVRGTYDRNSGEPRRENKIACRAEAVSGA